MCSAQPTAKVAASGSPLPFLRLLSDLLAAAVAVRTRARASDFAKARTSFRAGCLGAGSSIGLGTGFLLLVTSLLLGISAAGGQAQVLPDPQAGPEHSTPADTSSATGDPRERARRFVAARSVAGGATSAAAALRQARTEHLKLSPGPQANRSSNIRAHFNANLSAPWTPLGPTSFTSPLYGELTGRVTAIALDPNDSTGNTVYLGTTGGGVWKSTNAAGALASVSFTPLTDTLPVFSPNSGTGVLPSLSIGALAVQPLGNPVLLAGTGDPNDATDSLYGGGLLRSADGGLTWTLIDESHDGANGNHSFQGLATAGLAWSTASPNLVTMALSTSYESAVVAARDPTYTLPGLFYSNDAGQTWHMASIYDGAAVVQQPTPITGGGVAVTSVVWDARRGRFFCRSAHARVLQLNRWRDLDTADQPAWARPHGGELPDAEHESELPDLPRNPGGPAAKRRSVRADGGRQQQGPRPVAGPLQRRQLGRMQHSRANLGDAAGRRRLGGWLRFNRHHTGQLRSGARCVAVAGRGHRRLRRHGGRFPLHFGRGRQQLHDAPTLPTR